MDVLAETPAMLRVYPPTGRVNKTQAPRPFAPVLQRLPSLRSPVATLLCARPDTDAMVAMSVGEEHCVDTALATDLGLLWSR